MTERNNKEKNEEGNFWNEIKNKEKQEAENRTARILKEHIQSWKVFPDFWKMSGKGIDQIRVSKRRCHWHDEK